MQQNYPFCIAILAALLAVIYSLCHRSTSSVTIATMSNSSWHFVAQRGFFTHDDDPESWDFRATTQPSLGLRERSYPTDDDFWAGQGRSQSGLSHTQWSRFLHYISFLNAQNPKNERYKLLYVVRHGQGIHNVKETEVGREEWNVGRPISTSMCEIVLTASATLGQASWRRKHNLARCSSHAVW